MDSFCVVSFCVVSFSQGQTHRGWSSIGHSSRVRTAADKYLPPVQSMPAVSRRTDANTGLQRRKGNAPRVFQRHDTKWTSKNVEICGLGPWFFQLRFTAATEIEPVPIALKNTFQCRRMKNVPMQGHATHRGCSNAGHNGRIETGSRRSRRHRPIPGIQGPLRPGSESSLQLTGGRLSSACAHCCLSDSESAKTVVRVAAFQIASQLNL